MSNKIKVGMADMKTASAPDILTTIGLGSCVGVVIYDPVKKIAGMVHVMLPYFNESSKSTNKAKYADTGIVALLEDLEKLGVVRSRLVSKLAGGAQMFAFSQENDLLQIGNRNVEACIETLNKLKIPIVAKDTGGTHGRTIEFYIDTGILVVRTLGYGIKEI